MTGLAGTFIQGGAGRILVVRHEPDTLTNQGVLVVPAFAEEMNKSRRLVWETAQALREHGLQTIIPDLYGTGDSEGEFAEARWEIWLEDLCKTVEWVRNRGIETFHILLVRLGAALFMDFEARIDANFERAVVWHPINNGSEVIRQLLRIKSMAIRMSGGPAASIEELERSLCDEPDSMELGGYMFSPELARAVRQASFSSARSRSVNSGLVLECVAASGAGEHSSQSTTHSDEAWGRERIAADRFWVAVEPGPNPRLVDATVKFLAGTG